MLRNSYFIPFILSLEDVRPLKRKAEKDKLRTTEEGQVPTVKMQEELQGAVGWVGSNEG